MTTTTIWKTYAFACVLLLSLNVFSQNPGNVSSNLQLWVKANSGTSTTTNNAAVDTWTDNSPNGFSATKGATNAPTYVSEAINFNPALRFNRADKKYLKIPTASVAGTGLDITPSPGAPTVANQSSMSIFAAFLTDQSGAGTMFSRATNSSGRSYQLWLGDRDRVVHYTLARTPGSGQSDPDSGINYGITHARNDAKISSVTIDINTTMANDPNTNKILRYVNGYLDPLTVHTDGDAGFGTGECLDKDVLIGARRNSSNSDSGNELTGDIAEIIVYNRALNATERQKVESYLAIKYGITLGYNDEYYRWENNPNTTTTFGYSGTSNDYMMSNGNTAWDGSDNAGYGYNVFGIARDDDSALLQLKSKSVHVEEITKDTSILTMEDESGSISNDRDYLLVGNNGATVQLQSSVVPERILSTINRNWKARESSNDVGTVKLDFDLSQYSLTGPTDLELIVSQNSDLTSYKNYTGTYNSSTKTVTFTGVDLDDGDYFTLAKIEEIQNSYHLDFDGSTRFVEMGDTFDIGNNFSVSFWLNRSNGTASSTIISKRDYAFNNGSYYIRLTNGRLSITWKNGSSETVTSGTTIPENEWHHFAVTYGSGTLKIYIDGVLDKSVAKPAPTGNSYDFIIGASGGSSLSQYYKGKMDELRLWDTTLTQDQLRFIMNQEIEENSSMVAGKIIPTSITRNDVSTLPWGNLRVYFPFSHVRGNCLFNKSKYTTDNGRLYNTPTVNIETQTAPLPYVSASGGDWTSTSTWVNGTVQPIPGTSTLVSSAFDKVIGWNIVKTSHNITMDNAGLSLQNRSLLALFVQSNTITVDGSTASGTGNGLTVTHYLELDGDIDLNGESQLVQSEDSDLEVSSAGKIFRDQQGTADLYTYNYWSSPVGVSNTTSNNNNYTLPQIMKDGSQNINFLTSGYNGSNTSPIGIADYWIWKFANQLDDDYSAWQHVRSTGSLSSGEGFTMKGPGSGAITDDQNYVFTGKPNNGEITLPINVGNDYLVGNPYASAIDAQQFILDNGPNIQGAGNTTGTLYFWEHWGGGSHTLSEYQGGYATYNLSGGVPAAALGVADPDVDQDGILIGTKTPGRYIPVGQGFFVIGEATGTIKFNNGQRIFQKESSSSVFMEANHGNEFSNVDGRTEGSDDEESSPEDLRMKIRIGFNSVNYMYRQVLVTVDDNATAGLDWGYDAVLYDNQIDDMYWMIEDAKYVIQGTNEVTTETILPLGIHTNQDGMNKLMLDSLENVSEDLDIFVHDKELDIYHDLRTGEYEFEAIAGEHLERFEIVFANGDALSVTENELDVFDVNYTNDIESIVITNPTNKEIDSLELFNILGQSVFFTDAISNATNQDIKVAGLSTGTYIINIDTPEGKISKKVLIK